MMSSHLKIEDLEQLLFSLLYSPLHKDAEALRAFVTNFPVMVFYACISRCICLHWTDINIAAMIVFF